MKIVLNANNTRGGGGRILTQTVLKVLLEIAPMHEFLLFIPKDAGYPDFPTYKNVTAVYEAPSGSRRLKWFKKVLFPAIRQFEPNWIWSMGNLPLKGLPYRQSVMFADAHLLNYPFRNTGNTFRDSIRAKIRIGLQKHLIRSKLSDCNRIYTQTQAARKRFAETYSYPIEKISLCPNACSIPQAESTDMPAAMKPYENRFRMLAVTGYAKYKNLDQIAKMYHRHKEVLADTVFFLTAQPDEKPWRLKRLCKWIKDWELEDHFVFVGQQELKQLPCWYKNCHALLLPTMLESFSAMYVEAMAYDCAIITSDLDFAHDICGEAALYVNPFSIDSIKDGVLQLKNNEACRESLINLGRERYQHHLRAWPEILRDVLDQEDIEHN